MGWEKIQIKVDSLSSYGVSNSDIEKIPAIYFNGDYVDAKGLETINAIKTHRPLFTLVDKESKGGYSATKHIESPIYTYKALKSPLLSFGHAGNKANQGPFNNKLGPGFMCIS